MRQPLPYSFFARLLSPLAALFVLASAPALAQRLGGVPDRSFNPADSGQNIHPIYSDPAYTNWYSVAGGLIAHQALAAYDSAKPQYSSTSLDFLPDNDGLSQRFQKIIAQGTNLQSVSSLRGGVTILQVLTTVGSYEQLMLYRIRGSAESPDTGLGLYTPQWGMNNYSFSGLIDIPTGPNYLVWYTRLSEWHRNVDTRVGLIDTATLTQIADSTRELNDFGAEAGARGPDGALWLLGTCSQLFPQATDTTMLLKFNAAAQPVDTVIISGLSLLSRHYVERMQVLADGKVIVAGYFMLPGQGLRRAVLRLAADGSLDPSFPVFSLPMESQARFYMDAETNRIRVGYMDLTQGIAYLKELSTDGVMVRQAQQVIDPIWHLKNVLTYVPRHDAWMFETDTIGVLHSPDGPTVGTQVYRFLVSYSGQVFPAEASGGLVLPYNAFILGNAYTKRAVATGFFVQANHAFMPSIAVYKPDGELDPDYAGAQYMPDSARRRLYEYGASRITNVWPAALKRMLLVANPTGIGGNEIFLDRVDAYNFDGSPVAGFVPYRASKLIAARDGGFVGAAYTDETTGAPITFFINPPPIRVTVRKIDTAGNAVGVMGDIVIDETLDTVGNITQGANSGWTLRQRLLICEDREGAAWVHCRTRVRDNISTDYVLSRHFLLRMKGGQTKVIPLPKNYFSFNLVDVVPQPGGHYKLYGTFQLTNGSTTYYNVEMIDTLGHYVRDASFPRAQSWQPFDGYAGHAGSGVQIIQRGPDGKYIAHFNNQNGINLLRFYADGRPDQSFMPLISTALQLGSLPVIDSKLIIGGSATTYNADPDTADFLENLQSYGLSKKQGIHAFAYSMVAENTGYVQGRIEQVPGLQSGCAPAGPRRPAAGMLVQTGVPRHYAFTDTAGFYSMALDTGRYSVGQTIQNDFLQRQICPLPAAPDRTVHLAYQGDLAQGQDFINQAWDCPRLAVASQIRRLRICSHGTSYLDYRNDGMSAEPAARIRLSLPPEMHLLSADRAYTRDTDSTLVFDLGRLEPGAVGRITLIDSILCGVPVDSNMGCLTARIEPIALCGQISPTQIGWDGAWLDGEARYLPALGQVRFVVRNRGVGMSDTVHYALSGPNGLYRKGNVQLAGGDSVVWLAPATRIHSTTLQIDQPAGCPLGSQSQIIHVGYSLGRDFMSFGAGLLEQNSVQQCGPYRYSFDPNEKTVYPEGDIEPGTSLSYTIHFENRGTDTAYAVAVVDTLPAGLDLATLKVTGSSHYYVPEIAQDAPDGQAQVLFTFPGIRLPGKLQDSVASQGRVDFTIRTLATVPRGQEVDNRASIYFDRNPSVTTGYTRNRIRMLDISATAPLLAGSAARMRLWPNPTAGACTVRLPAGLEGAQLEVRSTDGQLLRSLTARGGSLFLAGLAPGMYLISAPGKGLRAERLVIVR